MPEDPTKPPDAVPFAEMKISRYRVSNRAFFDGVCPDCPHTFEEHHETGCAACPCPVTVREGK